MSDKENEGDVVESAEAAEAFAADDEDTSTATAVDGSNGDLSDETTGGDADALSEFVLSFSEPISKSDPCGEDVKYDENFETIKAEINKLGENDFELISKLSIQLLKEKTKDLLVASYLAYALTKKDGLSGFADGMGILGVLSDTFWEDLHPTRVPARRNALMFFAQKVVEALEDYKPTEAERSAVSSAMARFESFQSHVSEAMGEQAPALSSLQRVLSQIERRLPKPREAEAKSGESLAGRPTAPSGPPAEIQSASDASSAVTKAAAFLRSSDPKNPVPYRMIRALRWGQIVVVPPNESGKTRIPAPIEQRRSYLASLTETDDAQKLVEEAESSFQEGFFHFWLDLQRLSATAMEKLGDGYENARQAVLEETGLLLKRVPELVDLTYADGTPFVAPLCADWIDAAVRPLFSTEPGSAVQAAPVDGDEPNLETQKNEASRLLGKGDLQGAIAFMRDGSERDRSARDRFLRQLYLGELCMKGKRPTIARTIFESLDHTIEEHGLGEWEPQLALAAWSALHGCYQVLLAKAPPAEKVELSRSGSDVFDKICRIDAAYALTLPGT